MRHRLLYAITVIAATLALALGSAVPYTSADQTFHTERIPLLAVSTAPLMVGFVIDVHANGPQIFAQERYVLVGGMPNTTFAVQLRASSSSDTTCSSPFLTVPEATLVTNGAGNGEAGLTFTPAQAPPPGTYDLQWQVLTGTTVVYQTACTSVAVD